ncbi:MAG: hypothetical protein WCA78_01385 [Rhizomicrobium sp.]
MLTYPNTALALFPSTEGFGWIVFDGPLSPYDWGTCMLADAARSLEEKNARCLKKAESMLAEFHPAALVLEAFEGEGARKRDRIRALCRSIVSAAAMHGIPVDIIPRAAVATYFASVHPKTRNDVATAVAAYLPAIGYRLPEKRKAQSPEHPRMALFNAAALLFVHYGNPKEPL